MNRLPAVIIGASLGIGAFVGVEQLLDRPPQSTYAVERLQNCAFEIGHSLVPEVIDKACIDYRNQYKLETVGPVVDAHRKLVYSSPSQIDLLTKDLPSATATDQEIVRSNTVSQQNRLGGSILAGVLGLTVGSYYARKINLPTARKHKNQPSGAQAT